MKTNQELLKVALYARVSSEEQKQGHTIDSQITELRQFAAQREWPVAEVYSDEAWSGAALARPALDRMRDDARKQSFDAVLINDVDRLARDVTHLGIIKRDLERLGVRVIFRKIPSENSPTNNLLVNILGSFAEFEREMIMDRTRRGRRHKVETRQQFIGAIAPFGYRYLPATPNGFEGELQVNPEEAMVVRKMFEWVDTEGVTARDVAVRLTREGMRPRRGGKVWQRSSVLRVLHGTSYTGTWYYNKNQPCHRRSLVPNIEPQGPKTSLRIRPREEWIPVALPESLKIISQERWQRVQQQLDRNRCFSLRNSKHEYFLSALVRCGGCQSAYCGNASHGRYYYRCLKRCKRMPQISEKILDDSVWSALEAALNNPTTLNDAIKRIERPASSDRHAESEIESALSGIENEEKRILEAYRLTILTPEQLAHELELLSARRKTIEKRQQEFTESTEANPSVQLSIEEYCAEVRRRLATLTFETKRNVLRLLVRRIIFEGNQVRIQGIIPLAPPGAIATTGVDLYGHNPTVMANFSFTALIHRDYTLVRAANRANLAKANEALRLRRDDRTRSG
jgi:site-specific DNA recombinase